MRQKTLMFPLSSHIIIYIYMCVSVCIYVNKYIRIQKPKIFRYVPAARQNVYYAYMCMYSIKMSVLWAHLNTRIYMYTPFRHTRIYMYTPVRQRWAYVHYNIKRNSPVSLYIPAAGWTHFCANSRRRFYLSHSIFTYLPLSIWYLSLYIHISLQPAEHFSAEFPAEISFSLALYKYVSLFLSIPAAHWTPFCAKSRRKWVSC